MHNDSIKDIALDKFNFNLQHSNDNPNIIDNDNVSDSKITANNSSFELENREKYVLFDADSVSKYSSSEFEESSDPGFKDIRNIVSLWRAVILQAITDAVTDSKRTESIIAKQSAIEWFNINNEHFKCVCKFAYFSPYYVIERAKFAVENSRFWKKNCRHLKQ